MTRALGKAIGILVKAHEHECELHLSVDAIGAPSECHELIARAGCQRVRLARRRALHVAGLRSLRLLRREARRRMGNDAPIYRRYGHVPY